MIDWTKQPVLLGKKMFTTAQQALRDLNSRIGQLADLTTEDKSNVVNAISEAHADAETAYNYAQQIEGQLSELEGELKPLNTIGTYTYSATSIEANTAATVSPQTTSIPEGYTAIAVLSVASGESGAVIESVNAQTGDIRIFNTVSTGPLRVTPTLTVLCVKNAFFTASVE